jgi:orotate phosphoribosyltransferase-like protein
MAKSRVPVSVAKAASIDEKQRALHLRRGGATFAEIAAELNSDERRVKRIVQDALEDARAQVAASARELQELEASRLDALMGAIWDRAVEGNMLAIDRVLRLMERRAKMLGIDVAERSEEMTPEEIAIEAQRAIQRAQATSGAP